MNMNLGRAHTKLLKKINRRGVIRSDRHNIDDLLYLRDLGLIRIVSCPKEDDYYLEAYGLTEKGKGVLDNQILRYRDRLVPYAALILSILAIGISFLAFLLQAVQLVLPLLG